MMQLKNSISVYELIIPSKLMGITYAPVIQSANGEIRFPNVFCPTCKLRPSNRGRSLPEAGSLPKDDPILVKIRKRHRQMGKARGKISDDLDILMRTLPPGKLPGKQHPIWRRYDAEGSISPAEFHNLATDLKKALHLSANQVFYPSERIGILGVICNGIDVPDFSEVETPVVRRNAVDILDSYKITGWNIFDVNYKSNKKTAGLDLCELIPTGDGGLPSGIREGVDYTICEECGFRNWLRPLDVLRLDPSQWDGSDVFYFTDLSGIYVTENCKRAIEETKLTNVFFRPSNMPYKKWEAKLTTAEPL